MWEWVKSCHCELKSEHSLYIFTGVVVNVNVETENILVSLSDRNTTWGWKLATLSQYLTLSQQQILDSFKLKEFADDNFNFDENGREFSKQVENTVGKGEIARCKQFLLIRQCFQKTCTTET